MSEKPPSRVRRRRASFGASSLFAQGEPWVWLSGGALAICLTMVVGLLLLILVQGLASFWPQAVVELQLQDGSRIMGELTRSEPVSDSLGSGQRSLLRSGNYELTNEHFRWIPDSLVRARSEPRWGLVIERRVNGRFYGTPEAFVQLQPPPSPEELAALQNAEPPRELLVARSQGLEHARVQVGAQRAGDVIVGLIAESWQGPEDAWQQFDRHHGSALAQFAQRHALEKHTLGRLASREEQARLDIKRAELAAGAGSSEQHAADQTYQQLCVELEGEREEVLAQIEEIARQNRSLGLLLRTAEGPMKFLSIGEVVRAYPANQLDIFGRLAVYLSRWWEFLSAEPREANSEGGVFPAIFGTVVMTLLMALAVVPFGVLAAVYIREYARSGFWISTLRIAIHNLAGVPSIVYGVFGLGFFCYHVGKYIDGGPRAGLGLEPWSTSWWVLGLAVLVLLIVAATILGTTRAALLKPEVRRMTARITWMLWLGAGAMLIGLLLYTPFFSGFFRAEMADGSPTYGARGLLWASFTLALLTLPVVIVATDEALAAVPQGLREASYGCGASQAQTIWRVVLPHALPGILTGTILAMARGAGEVAPLMLVGAVKLAPELPVDGLFPFIHPERSFMHLGFHIYDLGFQSQNSEAAQPMVFTSTLLLVLVIALLNLTAVWLRARLRKKFRS